MLNSLLVLPEVGCLYPFSYYKFTIFWVHSAGQVYFACWIFLSWIAQHVLKRVGFNPLLPYPSLPSPPLPSPLLSSKKTLTLFGRKKIKSNSCRKQGCLSPPPSPHTSVSPSLCIICKLDCEQFRLFSSDVVMQETRVSFNFITPVVIFVSRPFFSTD